MASIRKLIALHGWDTARLSSLYGRPNQKRLEQIEGILETLKGLGL